MPRCRIVGGVTKLAADVTSRTAPPDAVAAAAAQLASILAALCTSAAALQPNTHEGLLKPLYALSLWTAPPVVTEAWLALLLHMGAAKAAFCKPVVLHLVAAFAPPLATAPVDTAVDAPYEADAATVQAHGVAVAALARVLRARPLAAEAVRAAAAARMPHRLQPRHVQCAFMRGLLLLAGARPTCLRRVNGVAAHVGAVLHC